MIPLDDLEFIEMVPAMRSEPVPPAPDHVQYDLRIPANFGKLVTVGQPSAPMLWFTWARPSRPLIPPLAGQHWIWIEEGPAFWIVDMVWDRSILRAPEASRLAFDAGLKLGIIEPGEEVLFYRNGGPGRKPRYGRMVAPALQDGNSAQMTIA